jgi:hypothetical protein
MGGKSRKSGGVSRKLIAHIKRGGGIPTYRNKKILKVSDEKRRKNLFDEVEELGDYS